MSEAPQEVVLTSPQVMNLDRMLEALNELDREQVQYVLVGGVAMNLHGVIRATEDVDVFLRAEADNVERLKRALRRLWDDPAIDEINAEDLAGAYPVIRYGPPDEDFVIDLIAGIGTEVRFEDLESLEVVVDDVRLHLATPETLYRMKRGTLRPIDRADAETLREKFGLED